MKKKPQTKKKLIIEAEIVKVLMRLFCVFGIKNVIKHTKRGYKNIVESFICITDKHAINDITIIIELIVLKQDKCQLYFPTVHGACLLICSKIKLLYREFPNARSDQTKPKVLLQQNEIYLCTFCS